MLVEQMLAFYNVFGITWSVLNTWPLAHEANALSLSTLCGEMLNEATQKMRKNTIGYKCVKCKTLINYKFLYYIIENVFSITKYIL